MPLSGAEYQVRSADEILAFLEAELRAEWGIDIDLTEGSAFRTFAKAVSEVDAAEVEPALKQVFDAGFLESAEEENLEKLVAILGIDRRSAVHATGVVEFSHGGKADQDYVIGNGTIVQTDSADPIEFETMHSTSISWFDDFEGGTLRSVYTGTTADFSVVDGSSSGDPTPAEGSFELKAAAVSGSQIINDSIKTAIGSKMEFLCYLQDTGTANATSLGNLFGVQDGSNHYRIVLDSSGNHAIEKVAGGTPSTLASTTFSVPLNEWVTNEVHWIPDDNGTIISRIYDSAGNKVDEVKTTGVGNDISEGGYGFISLDANDNKYWDFSAETHAQASVRAREGGPEGNVGANTLVTMPSVPNGVSTVTNLYPTGDDDRYLTDLKLYTPGRPEETDDELRDRAQVSEGKPGEATVPAIIAEASALEGAESVKVFENKTDTDNTGSGGLPATSFELVFFGTTPNEDIAEMLHRIRAFTSHDYGGANGTEVTHDVTAENGQVFTLHWSEPTELAVDMTLGIVVNEDFIGKEALRDRIVQYIGGTLSDGTSTLGTGTGEDVYVDQVEDVVTGPVDTGVIGISSYSFTPSVTTDANGLEIVDVGSNETATTNASDGSITLNVTRV